MISDTEAVAIARARAVKNGWPLVDPLRVTVRRDWSGELRHYEIVSDPSRRGAKTRFTIDASTGAIRTEGYLPR